VLDNQEIEEPPCPGMFVMGTVDDCCTHVTSLSCDEERQGLAPLLVMVFIQQIP
jgi:hypothetical protein